MKFMRMAISGLVLLASSAAFAGEVYKCVDADGKVKFSDTSCPDAAKEQTQTVKTSGPTPPAQDAPGKSGMPRGGYGGNVDRARELEQAAKKPQ